MGLHAGVQGVINGKRKTMARELKEIIAELKEWRKESPERSVVVIAGHDDVVSTSIT